MQPNLTTQAGERPRIGRGRRMVLAARTLLAREVLGFVRQKSRVIGALATPVVFWLLLGSGLNHAMAMPGGTAMASEGGISGGIGYRAYFFPGTVVMIVMFTTIFTAYSVIEDRREGFMQGVLVSPAPRLAVVMGKVVGGAVVATAQGLIFLAFWPIVGGWPGAAAMIEAALVLLLVAVALTSIGFCLAWPMESSAGFHAILNLTLFPMWFMSGAVFPYSSAPGWQKVIMAVNPLTYGESAFGGLLMGPGASGPLGPGASAVVMVILTIGLLGAAALLVSRRPTGVER
ncbi:MAG: ABC transporter permease [Phycisphaeraceae bacterium]|nr:ABC transporter permease [Phycisphaeraceae bacterium]